MNDDFRMSDEKELRRELAEVPRELPKFRDERNGILIALRSVERAFQLEGDFPDRTTRWEVAGHVDEWPSKDKIKQTRWINE